MRKHHTHSLKLTSSNPKTDSGILSAAGDPTTNPALLLQHQFQMTPQDKPITNPDSNGNVGMKFIKQLPNDHDDNHLTVASYNILGACYCIEAPQ
jgi:hypothetical protein